MGDIEVESEDDVEAMNNTTSSTTSTVVDELEILPEADKLYDTFQRLIVDQILSSHDRNKSNPFFMKVTAKQAFKVIEIELSLIYEALYNNGLLLLNFLLCLSKRKAWSKKICRMFAYNSRARPPTK
ncbi:hypothetical protein QJS04_geneDACA010012 [Acorus gramineus]|uniref:DUF4220 domain-containing protein n=1 Tax=Acorus gramineus TaxID=55184 RepID=A0AAV9BHD2_ACOGR|nr:hypothetical protein QJS04_geneDACA010012 [Acorus gramineus]